MGAPGRGVAWWCEEWYDRICAHWATLRWVQIWGDCPTNASVEVATPEQDAHNAEIFRRRASRGLGDARPS